MVLLFRLEFSLANNYTPFIGHRVKKFWTFIILRWLWIPFGICMVILWRSLMLNKHYRKFQLNEVMLVKDNRRTKQNCFSCLYFMRNRGKGETTHSFQGDRSTKRAFQPFELSSAVIINRANKMQHFMGFWQCEPLEGHKIIAKKES